MNINIDINDTQLSNLISKGIDDIDETTFSEIVRKSLTGIFSNPEVAKKLVLKDDSYRPELRSWVTNMLLSSITKEDIGEFKKMIFDIIEKHGKELIVEAMVKAFVGNLFSYDKERDFSNYLTNGILDYLKNNNGKYQ